MFKISELTYFSIFVQKRPVVKTFYWGSGSGSGAGGVITCSSHFDVGGASFYFCRDVLGLDLEGWE